MNDVGEAVSNVDYASIIAIAAKSPFGILALLIIAVSLAACVLFWNASDKARVFAFFLLFFGMSSFGSAVFYERLEQEKYQRIQAENNAQEERKKLELERQRRHELVLAEIKQKEEEERLRAERELEQIKVQQELELAEIKQKEEEERLRAERALEQIKVQQEIARLAHEKKMAELRQKEEQCKPRMRVVRNAYQEWIEEDAEENGTSKYSACRAAKRSADEDLDAKCDDMVSNQVGTGVLVDKRTSSDCDCEDLRSYRGDDDMWCEVEREGLCKYVREEEELHSPCL